VARYATGGLADGRTVFTPLTARYQGDLLKAKFSGLSLLSLDYEIRFHPAISADITSTYFIMNDSQTYKGYPVSGENSGGPFLGNEFCARVSWSPASDLQINLGGGVFLPSLGNTAPDADSMWRLEIKVVFSAF